jgi:hypothetical protein
LILHESASKKNEKIKSNNKIERGEREREKLHTVQFKEKKERNTANNI